MDLLLFDVDQNYRRGQSKPFANLTEFDHTTTELFNCVMDAGSFNSSIMKIYWQFSSFVNDL